MFGKTLVLSLLCLALAEDFYELLDIPRNADLKDIRKKFKEKALKHHPDKNKDDPEAHEKFVRINRAYEVLKDEDLRKVYDLHGEKGLDGGSSGDKYHSWNYYHDNFGIYDDDPEVITLNKADFEQSVMGSADIWFINYYHPMCSHCHTLAPVWRKVARELEGVVRIGAVNCDDDYHLCSSQGIRSYPTLISYPGRVQYMQDKTKRHLVNYMLHQVKSSAVSLKQRSFKDTLAKQEFADKPWIVFFYEFFDEKEESWALQTKLSAIFDGLVTVGFVECYKEEDLCTKLGLHSGLKFFDVAKIEAGEGTKITSLDAQEITREVLNFLPEMKLLDEENFKAIRSRLEFHEESVSWLIQFSGDSDDDVSEIRKLPALLPSLNLGRIKCSEMKKYCDDLYIGKTPTFMLFKPGGGYEVHHGRQLAHDIAVFAREGASAPRFQILTPQKFPKVLNDGSTWFVDFYAPWCPPCMKLLPEFRKASKLVSTPINFGSIDCTLHQDLCSKFNIHQYPTTILYNQSVPHQYYGYHTAAEIVDFIKDTLNPVVVELDSSKFEKLISKKPQGEIWVVDYFAGWCGPCQDMAPAYRKFARMMIDHPFVHVASIDCAQHSDVCRQQKINSYPSIKLYPASGFGVQAAVQYNWQSRSAESFRQWTYTNLPSLVEELDPHKFERMLQSTEPWLIDFYAPWCGHCHAFAPEFEDIAKALEGKVKTGKVNCDLHKHVCRSARVDAYPTVFLYRGSQTGHQQSPRGMEFPSLNKEDIINTVPRWLPKDRRHDEL
ncbi:dnaJ homolog subfamily C member 10-like [Eriocheir sinensis]|uniref:dnaJ homolog subfamily C member 10-like n=1 Tax=Eriocheir sinensis TaxID=95602 RepID=UPI0021C862AB|nr:dnaJ homolog subfamily C member 10-like [Eriocheir sinensis]XP_050723155.1 dnaJ homolog subfamily C member 10-like [Eriocheir sinensis]